MICPPDSHQMAPWQLFMYVSFVEKHTTSSMSTTLALRASGTHAQASRSFSVLTFLPKMTRSFGRTIVASDGKDPCMRSVMTPVAGLLALPDGFADAGVGSALGLLRFEGGSDDSIDKGTMFSLKDQGYALLHLLFFFSQKHVCCW